MTTRGPTGAEKLARRLLAPVDVAWLAVYRVLFGSLALWEVWRFWNAGWIARYYLEPTLHLTYFGFSWVAPWPGDGLYWHFAALAVLAACIIVGFCYRAAAALFWLGFTYVFLLEQATYLNHLYLFCLIAFLMIFLPAHRALSLDAWLRPQLRSEWMPAAGLWLARFQMGLVYSYAGLAKLNGDWLAGWPLRIWLPRSADFPLFGRFFDELWLQLLFSYGGLLLDLLAPFLLLWRPTRLVTWGALVFFHLSNAHLFGIGIFPWLSIASTLCFLAPDWPRRLLRWPRESEPPPTPAPGAPRRPLQRLGPTALGIWVAVQLLVPLRHFLYPGNVSWTEEGHNFAWHQKLRSKQCTAHFGITDPASGESWGIREREFLSRRQLRKVSSRPHLILDFAHLLHRHYRETEGLDVEVRAEVMCALNGRRPLRLVDPAVDLAAQPRDLWPKPWILPLGVGRPGDYVPE